MSIALLPVISCSSNRTKQTVAKKFKENDTTVVYTTEFVLKQKLDIVEVVHDNKHGAWMFINNGYYDSAVGFTEISTLGDVIKVDSSIMELGDMDTGFFAHRKFKGDSWVIEKMK